MALPGDPPQHPGRILKHQFMDPHRLGVNQLARALRVPPNRVSAILAGQRAITADTALRLGRFFATSPLFWMNLQARHDLGVAVQVIGEELETRVSTLAEHQVRPLDDSPPETDPAEDAPATA
ncbi:HigA family addiction module antitoxin [Pararhodospirillum oryzae]|uniref:Transcriptional regulator n=1 Tax=Pararhodospirillum oryzae TaxID=478448 RepID=A0A512H7Z2_9PROT|nr:HigA family addiction module antitoxin [Pararhodospirillum oryzae]GEO81575.1 transcriptional regulator [Pararhodospirillum oryzae]